jgi:outer membrane murein-binding lipoprotein Lpp
MTMKKITKAASAIIICMFLIACSASQEKIDEAAQAVETMKKARAAAEETYLDITDDSRKNEINILANEAKELESTDISKLGANKIDSFITKVSELTSSYQSMESDFSAILELETLEREDRKKKTTYNVYVANKTGMNFSRVVFHDVKKEMSGDNLVGKDAVLQDGYTLMGSWIDVYSDSDEWIFICENEADEELYYFRCDDLKGKNLEGKTLVLRIDPDSGDRIATISE